MCLLQRLQRLKRSFIKRCLFRAACWQLFVCLLVLAVVFLMSHLLPMKTDNLYDAHVTELDLLWNSSRLNDNRNVIDKHSTTTTTTTTTVANRYSLAALNQKHCSYQQREVWSADRNGSSLLFTRTDKRQFRTSSPKGYVSYCPALLDGRRMGNRLFNVAVLLHAAWTTGRRAVVTSGRGIVDEDFMPYDWQIDEVFSPLAERSVVERAGYDVVCGGDGSENWAWNASSLERVGNITDGGGHCVYLFEKSSMKYDATWQTQIENPFIGNKTLLLCGYFQSWKYFAASECRLRQTLVFSESLSRRAERFVTESTPHDWQPGSFALVGVHIRRGDFLNADKQRYGYAVPTAKFYRRAARYFVSRHRRVLFSVVSDDVDWARRAMTDVGSPKHAVVAFTGNKDDWSAELDLAVLTRGARDGIVIVGGSTFGWWAAWFANSTAVIYYAGSPRKGSRLDDSYRLEDYALPHWKRFY